MVFVSGHSLPDTGCWDEWNGSTPWATGPLQSQLGYQWWSPPLFESCSCIILKLLLPKSANLQLQTLICNTLLRKFYFCRAHCGSCFAVTEATFQPQNCLPRFCNFAKTKLRFPFVQLCRYKITFPVFATLQRQTALLLFTTLQRQNGLPRFCNDKYLQLLNSTPQALTLQEVGFTVANLLPVFQVQKR